MSWDPGERYWFIQSEKTKDDHLYDSYLYDDSDVVEYDIDKVKEHLEEIDIDDIDLPF